MIVSIIVTTKNEARVLSACLESIARQKAPGIDIEIIVVDNHSTDQTKNIALSFTDRVITAGPERSAQRNAGIRQARGEYCMYVDADMRLSEGVAAGCVACCQDNGCVGVYIPERIIGSGFWQPARDFERSFYNGTCIDAVRFVRRDVALAVGGFDEALTGPEDWDFDRKINQRGKTASIKSVVYHDEGAFNARRYIKKKAYYAADFGKYIARWGARDAIIRKQFGLWYRYAGVFFEQGKWKKLVKHPVLAVKMYILRILVGVVFMYMRLAKKRAASGCA